MAPPGSSPTILRRILAVVRWAPFVFILGLMAFSFAVLLDLHIRFTLIRQHAYIAALLNIAVLCALTGLSVWSFLVAVLKNPGNPRGTAASQRAWDTRPDVAGLPDGGETRWERLERKRQQMETEENLGARFDGSEESDEDEYRDDDDDDGDDDRGLTQTLSNDAESQEAPLLGSIARDGHRNERGNRHPVTNAFNGDISAALLPGQPQVPSRTGRAQLDDVVSLVTHAKRQRSDGRVFLGGLQVKNTGVRRWCHKCACEKPDRAHHCSACGICVLRMDHHCPWLASRCVGLRNHKAFFLFLTYTALLSLYASQATARELVRFVDSMPDGYQTSPISWAIVMFIGFIVSSEASADSLRLHSSRLVLTLLLCLTPSFKQFGLALVPFTAYHAYLILRNRTTLESMEGSGRVRISIPRSSSLPPRESVSDRLRRLAGGEGTNSNSVGGSNHAGASIDSEQWKRDEELTRDERRALKRANMLNIYNLGLRNNFCAVMGQRWLLWFVPIGEPESDGYSYEINVDTLRKLKETTAPIRGERQCADAAGEGSDIDSGRDDSRASEPGTGTTKRISSVRGRARGAGGSGLTLQAQQQQQKHRSAHGTAAWGAPPKRDFVLYDVDDDDDDSNHGNAGLGRPIDSASSHSAPTSRQQQMDADVWA